MRSGVKLNKKQVIAWLACQPSSNGNISRSIYSFIWHRTLGLVLCSSEARLYLPH
jgi:hypothetical protein